VIDFHPFFKVATLTLCLLGRTTFSLGFQFGEFTLRFLVVQMSPEFSVLVRESELSSIERFRSFTKEF